MEEIINAKIAQMGEWWERTADRASVPVLLTPSAEEGADAWELWLKEGRHPNWQITRRLLTVAEAEAIRREVPDGLNPRPGMPCDFYIRDGRSPGWNRSQVTKLAGAA